MKVSINYICNIQSILSLSRVCSSPLRAHLELVPFIHYSGDLRIGRTDALVGLFLKEVLKFHLGHELLPNRLNDFSIEKLIPQVFIVVCSDGRLVDYHTIKAQEFENLSCCIYILGYFILAARAWPESRKNKEYGNSHIFFP